MNLVFGFIAGMLLTNGVPHFVSGIMGKSHMTPLTKDSSALVNVVWAFINFVIGVWVFNYSGGNLATILSFDNYSLSFWIGSFALSLTAAWLFSKPNASFPWFKK
jgi:hypothetical protein